MNETQKIEMNKHYRTRDGRKVRVLCTDCKRTDVTVYTSPNQKDYEQELEAIVKQYKEYIVGLEVKAYTEILKLRAENATLSEKLDSLIK